MILKFIFILGFLSVSLFAQNSNSVSTPANPVGSIESLEKNYLLISTNDEYEEHKKIFKYGTYEKQLEVLKLIKKRLEELWVSSKNEAVESKERYQEGYGRIYTKLIEHYFGSPPNDTFEVFLIEWIDFFQLTQYIDLIEDFLNSPTKRQRGIDVVIKQKSLNALVKLVSSDNKKYQNLYFQYFQDKTKNGGHRELRLAALKGIKKFLPQQYRFEFKNAFLKEKNRDIKSALMAVITAYQEEDDIKFVEDAIKKERSSFLKSSYLTLMTNYYKFPQAKEVVLEFYKDSNAQVSESALAALGNLGSFSPDYNFYLDAGKKDVVAIRLKVVRELGKEKYQQDEVNQFLLYLSQNDEEIKIRELAKDILAKRGLLSDETNQSGNLTNQ